MATGQVLIDPWHSCNGHSSLKYPIHAAVQDKVIWLRGALARDSPFVKIENAIDGLLREERHGTLHPIATGYGQQLFFLAVSESCKKLYGCELASKDLVLRLLLPRDVLVAINIHQAWKENSLKDATKMICSLAPSDIPQIKKSHLSLFGVELEVDIENFTDGHLQKLLLRYVRLASAVNGDTDVEMVDKRHHENMLSFLRKKVLETKCPKKAIVDTLVGLREEHLSLVVGDYAEEFGISLEQDLLSRAPGHFERGLVTIIKCAVNRPLYFAEELYKAMRDPIQGMRDISQIDHQTIARIITTVAERDLMKIKDEYLKKFGSALEDDVSHAFSDRQDNLELILLLLNPNPRPLAPVTLYGHNNNENGSFSRANCSRFHLPPQSRAISEDSVRNY